MTATESPPAACNSRRPWFRLTPDRLVIGLVAVECLLWLSERFQWLPLNHHKGCTVLITVAIAATVLLGMLVGFVVSLLFRWRFQFSISFLLVLTVAVALPCSWFMAEIERAKKQKADVSEIRKSGGAAFFDWQLHAFDSLRTQEPPLPVWLRELLGEDFFASVVEVHLEPCSIPDALLSHVKALPQLRDLDIEGIELTDTQLEHIGELIQLRFLAIRYPKVSGCERKGLNALTQLEGLYIFHPPITDAGLQRLD